eukprot:1884914-Amphidinium_carterae.1
MIRKHRCMCRITHGTNGAIVLSASWAAVEEGPCCQCLSSCLQPLRHYIAIRQESARSLFSKMTRNGRHVTGLCFEMDEFNPRQVDVVLEPFHESDFPNGVDWRWGMTAEVCEKCTKTITSNSRRTRGPRDGWITIKG